MQAQIQGLENKVSALSATLEANHTQNRGDIHRLFNMQQTIADSVTVGLNHIAEKIGDRCDGLENDIVDLRLKWAKATGYSAGVAGICALLFELIKFGLDHIK